VAKNDEGATVARGAVLSAVCGPRHLRDGCHVPAGSGVALETGPSAFFLAREVVRLKLKPVVIDAHEARRKVHRSEQKSDSPDVLALCEGLRCGFYSSIGHVPSPGISELRTPLSRWHCFIRIQTARSQCGETTVAWHRQPSRPRGSLRTYAHWQRLFAGGIVPGHLEEHVLRSAKPRLSYRLVPLVQALRLDDYAITGYSPAAQVPEEVVWWKSAFWQR
jgi:hypothetical protein